jgi:hypothetical protein
MSQVVHKIRSVRELRLRKLFTEDPGLKAKKF